MATEEMRHRGLGLTRLTVDGIQQWGNSCLCGWRQYETSRDRARLALARHIAGALPTAEVRLDVIEARVREHDWYVGDGDGRLCVVCTVDGRAEAWPCVERRMLAMAADSARYREALRRRRCGWHRDEHHQSRFDQMTPCPQDRTGPRETAACIAVRGVIDEVDGHVLHAVGAVS